MKSIITLTVFFALMGASPLVAQSDDYKDLLFLIIDGDLEKAISKAERYTEKESTRRHPEPYVYLSMAYNEISKREEMSEDYPRAFRDAIKNASKFARYDKENEYVAAHENYLSELKSEIMREARYYYDTQNWRRSITYSKYVNRIDPTHLAAMLLKGTAEIKSRNEYQAKTTFEEADAVLANFSPGNLRSDEEAHLRYSIMQFAELMKERGEKQRAQPYVDKGEELFGDDNEFSKFTASY
jgi:hypothetical protein